jgi:hypothetical protein
VHRLLAGDGAGRNGAGPRPLRRRRRGRPASQDPARPADRAGHGLRRGARRTRLPRPVSLPLPLGEVRGEGEWKAKRQVPADGRQPQPITPNQPRTGNYHCLRSVRRRPTGICGCSRFIALLLFCLPFGGGPRRLFLLFLLALCKCSGECVFILQE